MKAISAVLGLFVVSFSFGQVGLMDQPQTFPWSVGLAPVVQEEAGGLAPGQGRVKTSWLWFNTFRQQGLGDLVSQQLDMEGLVQTVSASWSPLRSWELRTQVQGWILGGGVLDDFLSAFHGIFSFPNQGREEVQPNQYRDFLKGEFDLRTPLSGITQASLGVRWFSGPWSWSAWAKPPLPAPVDWGGTDRWAVGTGLGWGAQWPLGLDVTLGSGTGAQLILIEADSDFPGAQGGWTAQGGLYATVTTSWGPRGVVQGSWTRVPNGGEGYLSQGAGLLTSGIQVPVSSSLTLEFALTEEFFTWATQEVGLHLGVTWTSGGS